MTVSFNAINILFLTMLRLTSLALIYEVLILRSLTIIFTLKSEKKLFLAENSHKFYFNMKLLCRVGVLIDGFLAGSV